MTDQGTYSQTNRNTNRNNLETHSPTLRNNLDIHNQTLKQSFRDKQTFRNILMTYRQILKNKDMQSDSKKPTDTQTRLCVSVEPDRNRNKLMTYMYLETYNKILWISF